MPRGIAKPFVDVTHYPRWIQDVVHDTTKTAHAVANHEAWRRFSDGTISESKHHALLIGFWPLIERFPQFLALNLLKCSYSDDLTLNAARGWLIKNLRIEQRHAEWYRDWAVAAGIPEIRLFHAPRSAMATAITDWCWNICEIGSLAEGMAATNYAIEGVTGEWSKIVAESEPYQARFPESVRKKAMKWIDAHAVYDVKHPVEALDLVHRLLGPDPAPSKIKGITEAIQKSYDLYLLALDAGMQGN